jgi:hypothetical protein
VSENTDPYLLPHALSTFSGSWRYGMRNGKGTHGIRNAFAYRGFFVDGFRSSHGDMLFGKQNHNNKHAQNEESEKQKAYERAHGAFEIPGLMFEKQYSGFWIGGHITLNGQVRNCRSFYRARSYSLLCLPRWKRQRRCLRR